MSSSDSFDPRDRQIVIPAKDERADPPYLQAERVMLESFLEWHRDTLAVKCAGLDAAQLRERSAPPSTLSLLGLVRHLADVERYWFRVVLGGQDAPAHFWTEQSPDGDFDEVDTADVEASVSTWRQEVALARELAGARTLDDTGTRRGEQVPLRWIYIHMIEEYARHNGHADLLRERIDGVTGE
ncbi:DinB family protein [Streptacidiphilus neutrinimicus]|uniref:DinB family protein n=1 Tax=Streptacidiphilus neutrinimicus TaxID=105420 RepID=UPI000ADCBB1A|nr:DinB family protein [Streptacidiphilus neutrinimicus]